MEVQPYLESSLSTPDRITRQLYRLHTVTNTMFSNNLVLDQVLETNQKLLNQICDILAQAESKVLEFSKLYHIAENSHDNKAILSDEDETTSHSEDEYVISASNELRNSAASIPVSNLSIEELKISNPSLNEEYDASSNDTSSIESQNQESSLPNDLAIENKSDIDNSSEKLYENIKSDLIIEDDTNLDINQPINDSQEQDIEKRKEEERMQQKLEAQQRRQLLERAEKRKIIDEAKQKEQQRIEKWSKLLLEPRFDVSEKSDGFLITGYIPGMKKENVEVNYDENSRTLTLSGFSYPSASEEILLEQKLHQTLTQRYGRGYDKLFDKTTIGEFLLKMGSGDYGKFSEAYRIPNYANVDNISSSFEGGALRVAIPLKERNIMPRRNNQSNSRYNPFFSPMSRSPYW